MLKHGLEAKNKMPMKNTREEKVKKFKIIYKPQQCKLTPLSFDILLLDV
jgi:hypothetical protein